MPRDQPDNLVLKGLTLEQLRDRVSLRSALDRFRRGADTVGKTHKVDNFTDQALGILTSVKLLDALDLSKEDPRVLERYGESENG